MQVRSGIHVSKITELKVSRREKYKEVTILIHFNWAQEKIYFIDCRFRTSWNSCGLLTNLTYNCVYIKTSDTKPVVS